MTEPGGYDYCREDGPGRRRPPRHRGRQRRRQRLFPLRATPSAASAGAATAGAIGIFRLGLAAEEAHLAGEQAAEIVRPGWDIAFPGHERARTY